MDFLDKVFMGCIILCLFGLIACLGLCVRDYYNHSDEHCIQWMANGKTFMMVGNIPLWIDNKSCLKWEKNK